MNDDQAKALLQRCGFQSSDEVRSISNEEAILARVRATEKLANKVTNALRKNNIRLPKRVTKFHTFNPNTTQPKQSLSYDDLDDYERSQINHEKHI